MDQKLNNDLNEVYLESIRHALKLNERLKELINSKRLAIISKLDEINVDVSALKYIESDFNSDDEDDDGDGITTKSKRANYSLFPFFTPYLRDSRGFSAPSVFAHSSDDFSINATLFTILNSPKRVRLWTKDECNTMVSEVRSQYLQKYTKQLVSRLEELLEAKSQQKTPKLNEEINKLNCELALCKSKNLEPDRENCSNLIDWLVVAKYFDDSRSATDCELYYTNYLHSSVNTSEWTCEEDNRLIELVEECSKNDWDSIAKNLNTGRLAWQCCARYQSEFNSSMRRVGPIQQKEAEELLKVINYYRFGDYVNWNNVSCLVEGRSLTQIRHFWNKHNTPTVIRKWSKLEDKMILAGYKLYGPKKWYLIAKFLPHRTNRQIRERYYSHLGFSVPRKFGHWTNEEDELLLEMSVKYVKEDNLINFPEIQRVYFPNRNVHQLYRRYQYLRNTLPADIFANGDQITVDRSLFQKSQTRKRMQDSPKVDFTISDPEKIEQFLVISRRKLLLNDAKMESMINVEKTVQPKKPIEKETTKLSMVPTTTIVESVPVDNKIVTQSENPSCAATLSHQPSSTSSVDLIDDCLSLYVHLHMFYSCYHRKCVCHTNLDIVVNNLLQTVISESMDPSVKQNLSCLDVKETDFEGNASQCSLDTVRFFMTNTSIYLNPSLGNCYNSFESDLQGPKSMYLPNYDTLFGFSLLRLMTNSMVFQLAENVDFDFNEEEIGKDENYVELKSMFCSLFLWPALISSTAVNSENVQSKISTSINEAMRLGSDAEQTTEMETPKPKEKTPTRGRPRKRSFFQPVSHFVRKRSFQFQLFGSRVDYRNLQTDTLVSLRSHYWPLESKQSLLARVKHFYETVWREVNQKLDEKDKTKKSKKSHSVPSSGQCQEIKLGKPRKPKVAKSIVPSSEDQQLNIRRSTRERRSTITKDMF